MVSRIYIFDTTAYSELVRGDRSIGELANTAIEIFMPSFVVAELRYGFALGSKQLENERALARFLASKKVRMLLPDNATTDYYVTLSIYARKKGVKLSTHDLWIASLAQQWDAILVTHDQDFNHLAHPDIHLFS